MIPLLRGIKDEADAEFIEKLYLDFKGRMFTRAYGITKNREAAEDIVQETFVKLIEKTELLKTLGRQKMTAYVLIAAKATAINYYNKRKLEQNIFYYDSSDILLEKLTDPGELPEEVAVKRDMSFRIMMVIGMLPKKEGIILKYKYIFGLSDEKISELLGISKNSVRTYLSRARERARTESRGRGPQERIAA